jgi:hypothetical protein
MDSACFASSSCRFMSAEAPCCAAPTHTPTVSFSNHQLRLRSDSQSALRRREALAHKGDGEVDVDLSAEQHSGRGSLRLPRKKGSIPVEHRRRGEGPQHESEG